MVDELFGVRELQRAVGEALELLRERSGLSQREAAERIDYDIPKLSRIENGQLPDIHALRTMLDAYGVIGDEVEPFLEMWKLAKEKGWRQQRLVGDKPVHYHALIAESALRHADRDQLLHIDRLGLLPNVTIQVVLDMAGLYDGHNGPFTLLDFPFAGDPRVLFVEHAGGSMHIEDPNRVKAATFTFKHLSKLASTPEESAAWIGRLAAER